MLRRKFLQQSLMTSGALLSAPALFARSKSENNKAEEKPFNLNYAIHDGTFKNLAGDDFIEQIKFAYSMGFRAIEDNGMMSRPVGMQKKIGDTLSKLGMSMGVFVITSQNWHWKTSLASGKQEWIDLMAKDCR